MVGIKSKSHEKNTNDNLNASVDAQVYFRVKADEGSVKGSTYNVNIINGRNNSFRQKTKR